ncbi:hypothetical protein EDC01DRAFT_194715 [Geopyxis carbonaria]|nr:hypothetical protein EDC01DRAFT_194715 [Geopyxis carbonaria]
MFGYAESVATRNTVMSSIRQTIEASYSKPTVSIKIHDEPENGGPKYYTTGDRIEGEVSIVASSDVRFDEVSIAFEGTSRTWLEKFGASPATSGRTSMTNTFLRTVQPVDETKLPIPRVVTPGQTVTLPFTFVVPASLLPDTCKHTVENSSVEAAHLRLPPSLGDLAALGGIDDQAPDMAHISYAIRARVTRRKDTAAHALTLASHAHRVLISPAAPAAPPLHIAAAGTDPDFTLHKEKDLRRGLLGRKLGRLSATAQQPAPLHVALASPCPATTTVPVTLTFAAADWTTPPPPLDTLTTKLRTATFFATTRTPYLPTPSRSQRDLSVGCYWESTLLSARSIGAVGAWKLATSASGTPPSRPLYTADLIVPVTAPKGKALVPSFASCYIARSYLLELTLGVRTGKHSQPTVTLKVPLQVAQLPVETEEVGVEEFFTPRSVAPPPEMDAPAYSRVGEGTGTGWPLHMRAHAARLPPPPGYSVYGGGQVAVAVPIPHDFVGISPGCG